MIKEQYLKKESTERYEVEIERLKKLLRHEKKKTEILQKKIMEMADDVSTLERHI